MYYTTQKNFLYKIIHSSRNDIEPHTRISHIVNGMYFTETLKFKLSSDIGAVLDDYHLSKLSVNEGHVINTMWRYTINTILILC